MKVRCTNILDGFGRPVNHSSWVKIGDIYHVLSILIAPGKIRYQLVGGEPIPALFESQMFEIVSSIIPETWQVYSPKLGCLALEPSAWQTSDFWEDYFNDKSEAIDCFEEERRKIIESDP